MPVPSGRKPIRPRLTNMASKKPSTTIQRQATKITYNIPEQSDEVIYEIKKSRFITRVANISNKENAKTFLEQAKRDYPDARHHCWAYQFGPPHSPHSAAMSDDGEPSGTAGKPILNVIQHKDIGDIMIVVIRYFGGIKLGAGGLVRAYSNAAQQAIENLTTKKEVATVPITVKCDFSQEQTVRHWLTKKLTDHINVEYQNNVIMHIHFPIDQLEAFKQKCIPLGITVTKMHEN